MDDGEIILGFIFGGAIVMLILFVVNAAVPPTYTFEDIPIISLNDGSRISGSFTLGSGSIDETPVFVFYKREGKAYRLETVTADETLIYEDEEEAPFYRIIYRKQLGGLPVQDSYEFHVPKNTIIRQMVLDTNLRTV